ncbi:unnamed protein product [Phaeothamnion confervicola]
MAAQLATKRPWWYYVYAPKRKPGPWLGNTAEETVAAIQAQHADKRTIKQAAHLDLLRQVKRAEDLACAHEAWKIFVRQGRITPTAGSAYLNKMVAFGERERALDIIVHRGSQLGANVSADAFNRLLAAMRTAGPEGGVKKAWTQAGAKPWFRAVSGRTYKIVIRTLAEAGDHRAAINVAKRASREGKLSGGATPFVAESIQALVADASAKAEVRAAAAAAAAAEGAAAAAAAAVERAAAEAEAAAERAAAEAAPAAAVAEEESSVDEVLLAYERAPQAAGADAGTVPTPPAS